MPAIRNAILMILAHKTSHELLERAGKEQLAAEILRETVRPLGITIARRRTPRRTSRDASGRRQPDRSAVEEGEGGRAGPAQPGAPRALLELHHPVSASPMTLAGTRR